MLEDRDAYRVPVPPKVEEDPATAAAFEKLDAAKVTSLDDRRDAKVKAERIEVAGDHLNAERFLVEHGDRVRYAPELGRWLVWSGAWWVEDRLDEVHKLANATIDGLRSWVGEAANADEFKRRARHYSDSTRSGRRDGMLAIARPEAAVAVDQLDCHPHLLACPNGTVNLRTGELLPADRDHLITRGVEVDYNPDATSATWERFLAEVFATDGELIAYVRRLVGYCSTGESSEHVLVNCHGSGANGKTTFLSAIEGVLGEHAVAAPEGLLVEQRHEQHPERLAMLRGRRLVVSTEFEKRSTLAEGLVKQLTGSDRISARYMYGQRFDFTPTHTLVIVTNHLPRVRGTDEAIWRRLKVIPFAVTIPTADRIADLGKVLAVQHGQAVLAWIVRGAVEWYRDGLGKSKQVRQATDDYRQREDVFASFLSECTVEVRGRTKVKELRLAWIDWAKANGAAVGRTQDFIGWLEAHGSEMETYQGARFARGIGISTGSEVSVRSREVISGNFPHTPPREEVYGREVTRPHEIAPEQGVQSQAHADRAPLQPDPDGEDYWSSKAGDEYLSQVDDTDDDDLDERLPDELEGLGPCPVCSAPPPHGGSFGCDHELAGADQ